MTWADLPLLPAFLCLGFALLIQIGTNFANDYFDYKKGADTPDRIGPLRAVASGLVEPTTMLWAMIIVLILAFLTGLALLPHGGPLLLCVGIISLLCAFGYTGGPFPLAYLGLGDIFRGDFLWSCCGFLHLFCPSRHFYPRRMVSRYGHWPYYKQPFGCE